MVEGAIRRGFKYCHRTCGVCTAFNVSGKEILALKVLRNRATITENEFTSWVGDDICNDWEGVFCENGHVVELRLTGTEEVYDKCYHYHGVYDFYDCDDYYQHLETSIPAEFSLLTELRVLILDNVGITGTIPTEISVLTNLVSIDLYDNKISGTLPQQLSTLSNLLYFKMVKLELEGYIPDSFSTIVNMTEFYLSQNKIQGTLPPSLSTWSNITVFNVFSNEYITGTLPQIYSTWQNIEYFNVEVNSVSGTLPPEYSLWAESEKGITYDNNDFDGFVPIEYSVLMVNNSLYIHGNDRLCIEEEVLYYFQELEGRQSSPTTFHGVDLCDQENIVNKLYGKQEVKLGLLVGVFTTSKYINHKYWKRMYRTILCGFCFVFLILDLKS